MSGRCAEALVELLSSLQGLGGYRHWQAAGIFLPLYEVIALWTLGEDDAKEVRVSLIG